MRSLVGRVVWGPPGHPNRDAPAELAVLQACGSGRSFDSRGVEILSTAMCWWPWPWPWAHLARKQVESEERRKHRELQWEGPGRKGRGKGAARGKGEGCCPERAGEGVEEEDVIGLPHGRGRLRSVH